MERVEWHDVQGLVRSGYGRLPHAAFVLWRFRPDRRAEARRWLGALAARLMRADAAVDDGRDAQARPTDIETLKSAPADRLRAINVAFTASGLRRLEVDETALLNFSLEFLEGMAPKPNGAIPRRTNALGDLGESSPQNWDWGGWARNGEIDGMLLLYAGDEGALRSLLDEEMQAMAEAAAPVGIGPPGEAAPALTTRLDRNEHFGYADGISQPIIEREKERSATRRIHGVKPGEFVLGYRNERRAVAIGAADPQGLLRNGSYLVARQLEQDVAAFDRFVADAAARAGCGAAEIAAKLLGRNRDGRPLVRPLAGQPDSPDRNDFLYHFDDRFGLQCPVGAHIRRANPRDSDKAPDPESGLRMSKMHRIIRRSRMYGDRFDPGRATPDHGRRGILFLCLNADIAGQFEMIQHSWLNNRHFGDLHVGADPLGHYVAEDDAIVIQRRPTNIVLERGKPFVRVRGGAYFFLPGVAAVKALATASSVQAETLERQDEALEGTRIN